MKRTLYIKMFVVVCLMLAIMQGTPQAFSTNEEASLEKVIYMLQVLTGARQSSQTLMERGSGAIEGRVVLDYGDSTVWEPVRDAQIVCQMENGELAPVKTNEEGFFKLVNLPAGPKVINFFKQGFAPISADVIVQEGVISNIIIRPKPADDRTGSVEGVILTPSNTGETTPVQDAVVKITPSSDEITSILTTAQPPVDIPPVKTDSSGYFRFDKVPVGAYLIVADKINFKRAIGVFHVSSDKTARVDLVLFPENATGFSSLFGRVVELVENTTSSTCQWQKIAPIPGAVVSLATPQDNKIIQTITTGERGVFHFMRIPTGSYILKVEHSSFQSYQQPIDIKDDFSACMPTITASAGLSPGRSDISSEVSPEGAAVVNQFTDFVNNFGSGCFCIDPNGNWHHGVNFIRIVLNRTSPRITSLSGFVYDVSAGERKPLSGVNITASLNFPYPTLSSGVSDSTDPSFVPLPSYTAKTGENGQYQFSEIPQGEYKVTAALEGYHPWEKIINVSEGINNILTILMVPASEGAILKGYVYNGANKCLDNSGISGDRCITPVPKALVYLFYRLQTATDQVTPTYKTETDETGYYAFPNLQVGQYRMIIKAEGFKPWEKEISIVPGENAADITLFPIIGCEAGCSDSEYCSKPIGKCDAPGICEKKPEACIELFAPVCGCDGKTYENACYAAASGISIRHEGKCFSTSPGSLSGYIYQLSTSSEKKVIPDAKVLLYSFSPDGQNQTLQTISNADGFYQFSELTAGVYVMVVEAAGYSAWKQEIKIIPDEYRKLDVFLVPVGVVGSLKGKIADTSSNCEIENCPPLQKVFVGVYSISGGFNTVTNAAGIYQLLQLPVGEYRLIAKAEGYQVFEESIRINAGENIRDIGLTKQAGCKDDAGCEAGCYCSKQPGDCSGQGLCVKKQTDVMCILVYDPVCGCNGKTYGNACEAKRAGANIAYKGACLINP